DRDTEEQRTFLHRRSPQQGRHSRLDLSYRFEHGESTGFVNITRRPATTIGYIGPRDAEMVFYAKVLVLALIQGAAELLPVSSSAHVILAEKLMKLDPGSPAMVFLLIMLHTGTMFAAVVYFWSGWKAL